MASPASRRKNELEPLPSLNLDALNERGVAQDRVFSPTLSPMSAMTPNSAMSLSPQHSIGSMGRSGSIKPLADRRK
jgi:hypothetical protein